jgi:hypothetical protein
MSGARSASVMGVLTSPLCSLQGDGLASKQPSACAAAASSTVPPRLNIRLHSIDDMSGGERFNRFQIGRDSTSRLQRDSGARSWPSPELLPSHRKLAPTSSAAPLGAFPTGVDPKMLAAAQYWPVVTRARRRRRISHSSRWNGRYRLATPPRSASSADAETSSTNITFLAPVVGG